MLQAASGLSQRSQACPVKTHHGGPVGASSIAQKARWTWSASGASIQATKSAVAMGSKARADAGVSPTSMLTFCAGLGLLGPTSVRPDHGCHHAQLVCHARRHQLDPPQLHCDKLHQAPPGLARRATLHQSGAETTHPRVLRAHRRERGADVPHPSRIWQGGRGHLTTARRHANAKETHQTCSNEECESGQVPTLAST